MRISESPFKCPYPFWVVFVVQYLSISLPSAILFVQARGQVEESIFMGFSWLLVIGLLFHLLLPLQFFLVVGSIWVAFQDNPVFGWGCVIFLLPLLIPGYHTLALRIRFALQERKKLRSFVGREGMLTSCLNPCTGVVEIDGEEFDAYFRDGFISGSKTVFVKRARWTYLDAKMESPMDQ